MCSEPEKHSSKPTTNNSPNLCFMAMQVWSLVEIRALDTSEGKKKSAKGYTCIKNKTFLVMSLGWLDHEHYSSEPLSK
jgi:hypothetical protein